MAEAAAAATVGGDGGTHGETDEKQQLALMHVG